ncbi:hypothetical protein GALMADRAFT_159850 [Galerina marginata CBS 339.88]|uniref:F-box domain-containing protein n=1 Tax=Galerina marginata (strain CBS 339.88) TaxID=685588 RepID=A0A067SL39_GALM3|nr:hypothetical protein GALMADRAFT_159850 [Galerina marginata CBS 339.88]
MFATLATEMLENVFSYLSRRDLTSVTRVCGSFAFCGRLLLYRSVEFCSADPHIGLTLKLLRENCKMGVKILSAILTTHRPAVGEGSRPWIEPDFLVHWKRLHSLELRGFPFSSPHDVQLFTSTLRRSCPKLEHFTFQPQFGFLPSEGFELSKLKAVKWKSELATIDMPIMPIMTASIDSLTHISFVGTVVHRRDKPYDEFLQLQFPCLKSLELGSLLHSNSEPRTNTTITKFILDHAGIEHLSLGRSRPKYFYFQFDLDLLKPESLLSLKSFEGFPENITAMARLPVHSLFSLASLSICCQKDENDQNQPVDEMFLAIQGGVERTLPSVRYLRFNFVVSFDHRMTLNQTSRAHLDWMDKLSHICPGVVEFWGNLPPMTSGHIIKMFEMYEHLETISLMRLSIFPHMPTSQAESYLGNYFKDISEKCKKLKTVVARKPPFTQLEDWSFTLKRDRDGKLTAVDEDPVRIDGDKFNWLQ